MIEHSLERSRRVLAGLKQDRLKLASVSGILTTRPGLIAWVDRNVPEIELITTKSYQVRPNPGYPEPVLVETAPGCYGNAVGLRNPGMQAGYAELAELRRRRPLRCLLNVSLSADCIEDFAVLLERFEPVADLFELNLSCPHAKCGYGAAIGGDPDLVEEYMRGLRPATRAPIFVKLTPNVTDIGAIARAAMQAGADGITAVNTFGPEVFREPVSGLPILSNPNGHKGGRSGEWIKAAALEKVAELRAAVGGEVPIIGVGGVSSGQDAARMRAAGADLVGLGSVFARVPRQSDIPAFVAALARDCSGGGRSAASYLAVGRRMEYKTFRIAAIRELGAELRVFELEGRLELEAGQFVFLYLPGVGEKPFSLARGEPATVMMRLKGPFTRAAFGLAPGDRFLLRGPYGAAAPDGAGGPACLVAGGTGLAAACGLAERLRREGRPVTLYFGAADRAAAGLLDSLDPELPVVVGLDAGRPGRILELLADGWEGRAAQTTFYNIGPLQFMRAAMELEESLGASPEAVISSLETLTMCGVGLCGGCECGGRLLCKEGTFVSLDFLRREGVMLEELDAGPGGGVERRLLAAVEA